MKLRLVWLLPLDLLCLSIFILLGLQTHDALAQASALERFVLNLGPLAAAWLAAGLALGAFRFASPITLRAVLARTLTAWLVAAPLGIVLRALLLRSSVIVVPFFLITLTLGGALLLLGRAVFVWLAARYSTTHN
jgi:hypothetical protein